MIESGPVDNPEVMRHPQSIDQAKSPKFQMGFLNQHEFRFHGLVPALVDWGREHCIIICGT